MTRSFSFLALFAAFFLPSTLTHAADVTVIPSTTHQTMRGWEVMGEGSIIVSWPRFLTYQQAAIDKVVEAGQNRIRLEVRAGFENPVDAFANWQAAGYPGSPATQYVTWRAKRYETINDNNDPNVINPAGFHFTELDQTIDLIVNPMRAKLAAKGESLYVNLNYVAFLGQVTSGVPYVHGNAAEYAESMLALFQHMQSKYGWTPNALEVILEPDNTNPPWSGTYIGQVIAATGARLAAAGFTPEFIGPSTTAMANAVPYFDQIMAVPNAATYLKELSYHRYFDNNTQFLQTIASRAQNAGISTSMLEWWSSGNSYHVLHEDLKLGRNSSWQQATIVDLNDRNGLGTAYINPNTPTVAEFTNPTKFFIRYYQHVRMGAVRVGATAVNGSIDPLAFRNTNGRYAVVIKMAGGGPFTVGGLPAGTYGIEYTEQFTNNMGTRPDQTIAANQDLSTDIPSSGVIVIYGKSGGPVSNPCDLNGSGGVNVVDVQLGVAQAIGVSSCLAYTQAGSADINRDGSCNVVDIQRLANAALGGACVSP
jgi:hypothetical protein